MARARRRRPRRLRSGRGAGRQRETDAIVEPICFAQFELGTELRKAEALVPIARKPFAMLCYLASHRDRVVTKAELLDRIWPDVSVSDAAFSSALKDLRRALGDDGAQQSIIRTVRGRGLHFAASVHGDAAAPGARARTIEHGPGKRAPRMPFVGRGRELRHLVRCAEEVARGRPRVAVVIGDPGTGKSRLVEELIRHPSSAEYAVAVGYCEDGSPTPYLPFVQALSALQLERDDDAPRWHRDHGGAILQQLLRPVVLQPRPLASSQRDTGLRDRADLFRSIWRMIVEASRRKPTLIAIEDLHHADAATLDLYASLAADVSDARGSEGAAVLLVATAQPPPPGSRLAVSLQRILSQSGCSSVSLSGLGVRATAELLAALGIARTTRFISRAFQKATGGNPLFILDSLLETERSESLEDYAPGDVRRAVASRIARMDEDGVEVLRVAAFIGERFGLSVLSSAVARSAKDLMPTLRAAIDAGILVGEERSFRFAHALVREVLRDATPLERRREIHGDLATVLEDHYASDQSEHAMEIARHLIEAGDRVEPDRLISYAKRAGDHASAIYAWLDALSFYEAALDAPARFSFAERAELHLRAGLSASSAANAEKALDHYERAVGDFRAAGDEVGTAWAMMYSSRTRFNLSPGGFGLEYDLPLLAELLGKLGESEPALRALLLDTIAVGTWGEGRVEQAEEIALQGFALAQRLDDDAVCHHVCMTLALTRFSRLRLNEALASWIDADVYARRARDPWLETMPGSRIANALLCLGRFDEARERIQNAKPQARRAHNLALLAHSFAQEASLELAMGGFSAAETAARAALAPVERAYFPWAGAWALVVRAGAAAQRGAWEQAESAAEALLEPGQAFAEESSAARFFAAVFRTLVRSYRSPGDIDTGAFAQLVGQAPLGERSGFVLPSICALTEVACEIGARERISELEGTLEVALAHGFLFSGGWSFSLSRLLGRCAVQSGRFEAAEAAFDRAIEVALASGARVELARSYLDRARARAQCRDDARDDRGALTDASTAAQLAAELGMGPLEQQAQRFARAYGAQRS